MKAIIRINCTPPALREVAYEGYFTPEAALYSLKTQAKRLAGAAKEYGYSVVALQTSYQPPVPIAGTQLSTLLSTDIDKLADQLNAIRLVALRTGAAGLEAYITVFGALPDGEASAEKCQGCYQSKDDFAAFKRLEDEIEDDVPAEDRNQTKEGTWDRYNYGARYVFHEGHVFYQVQIPEWAAGVNEGVSILTDDGQTGKVVGAPEAEGVYLHFGEPSADQRPAFWRWFEISLDQQPGAKS